MNTNSQYYKEFLEIIKDNPELVRMLLRNYGIHTVANPTIDNVREANSEELITKIFGIRYNDNISYVTGTNWLNILEIGVPAVKGILGEISGANSSSNQENSGSNRGSFES